MRLVWPRVLLVCSVFILSLPAMQTSADEAHTKLSILLTNDDGYDSHGIKAVATALQAAGHRVTIVAPLGQRSGSGMKITLGELAVVEQSPNVWSVDASPADSVSIGLRHIMREARPDLVVSGANFGQNLGANVMISGTVGAAMMAVLDGVPAVAISVGLNLDEAQAEPEHFPSTIAAFPRAAAFTLAVVNTLANSADAELLAPGQMLNINYPALDAKQIKGAVWSKVGQYGGFTLIYPTFENGSIRSWIEADARGLNDGASDTAQFAAGYVTLSMLRPDWNLEVSEQTALRARLGSLQALLAH